MKNLYSKILKITFVIAGYTLIFAQYSNGYIVTNEGNFGSPNAEISYIDENNVITNNVYALANDGATIGDILQSIYFNEGKSYMVVNNSNKLIVVNRTTFVKTTEITDNIIQPRYTTIANGKLYTTNWGNGSSGKFVSVHNATTYIHIKNIPLSQDAEEILTVNGKVYVMKASFSTGNSIEVIDATTDTIIKTITLSNGLQSIKASGNDIFALCSSGSGSTVYKINTTTDTIADSVENTDIKSAWKFALDGANLYIANGLNVYSLTTDLSVFSSTPIFSVASSQGWDEFYGFAAIDGKIFQGNANGFIAPSILNVYNPTGTILNTFTATMGINGVYKNVFDPGSLSSTNVKPVSSVTIYPNPVSETLYIKNANSATYKIFDLSGKLVKHGVYQNGITISGLGKGAYIIQILDKNVQKTEKFIVK